MVKMLVGQGAAVEQRNGSKLTAYDVATDHVIRQFLLPLQLKVSFEIGSVWSSALFLPLREDFGGVTLASWVDVPRNQLSPGISA